MAVAKRELGGRHCRSRPWLWGDGTARGAARPRHHRDQAEAILNKVLDAASLHRHVDRLRAERGADRPLYLAPARRISSGQQMRLSGRRAPGTTRQRGTHVFTRDNVVAGVEQSLVRMKTEHLDVVQFHASPSRQTWRSAARSKHSWSSERPARCDLSACPVHCPI